MLPKFPFHELHTWYLQNGRHDLPWRNYDFDEKTLVYRVWLAETMLQQTQVERVRIYFENILRAFPTVEDLARTSYEDFFPYYKGLGYYSRARNMLKAAEKVVSDFEGVFPRESQELRTLPGVGPYTAEAIRAFAYDIPTLSFDTNLEKIFSRYYFGTKFQKLSKEEKEDLLEQMREFCDPFSSPHKAPHPNLLLKEKGRTTTGSNVVSSSPLGEELGGGVSCREELGGGVSRREELGGGVSRENELGGISRNINNALMDYGATISLNTISGIDWETYPFPESKFYQTRGSLEPVIEKKKSSFPTRDAYVLCILHESHKKYLSIGQEQNREKKHLGQAQDLPLQENRRGKPGAYPNNFTPFYIGKNSGNPRAMIQSYFMKKYNLELSVRPPEIKSFTSRGEIPYMICYAQIQSGTHNFQVFENMKVRGYEESFVEEMEFGDNLSLF